MNYHVFMDSPLRQKNYYSGEGKWFASPLKDMRERTVFVEDEKIHKNDSYRQRTKYDDQADRYFSSYDVGVLTGNEESYLEGRINSKDDVDCYSFSYRQKAFYEKMGVSTSVTIQLENLSGGKDVELSVYDSNGNYVESAKDRGNGCKELTIPEYEGCPNQFVIRVVGVEGQEADSGAYRIKIKENRGEKSETPIQTNRGGKNEGAGSGDSGTVGSRKKGLSEIRWEEYNALPEQEQYHGKESVEELLRKWAAGEALSVQEKNYLKIFANLADQERAAASGYIKSTLYPQIQEELRKAGISVNGEWGITVDIYGNVSVTGEMPQEEKDHISDMVKEKFADKLWDSYMQASDYSPEEYQRIVAYREVNDFIRKSTGGAYRFDDIELADGGSTIIGLPEKMCRMLNSQESNGRYEQLRDDIYLLLDCKSKNRMPGVVGAKVAYRFHENNVEIF